MYLLGVICVASIVLPMQDWAALAALPHQHIEGLIFVVGLAVLSEMLYVRATVGTHQMSTTITFIPYFACVLLFPPVAAIGALVITSLASQLYIHKKPLLRSAFNAAQASLALIIACEVYESLGGKYTSALQFDQIGFPLLGRLVILAGVFFFLNQVFVGVAIALLSGNRFSTTLSRMVAPSGMNLLFDVAVSPIAFLVAALYGSFGSGGLMMGVLPLLIIRHSVASTVKLQQANKDLLSVLVKTIETRDPYTSGHSIRVSILARAIAEDMNLSASAVDKVETAALVHDIGKVDTIYASLIRKDGALTEAERHVIVTHAAKGAEFLKTLTFFSNDLIAGVRHHHERYDGSGYPEGLSGESIPLPARIIQLCDSIDAMLSDRPYRKALPIEFVRGELLRCAGTQFDPRIVDIILKRNTLERAAALVRPETGARLEAGKPQLVVSA